MDNGELEIKRLRYRLLTLLSALAIRKQCWEISAVVGVDTIADALHHRPINYTNMVLGGVALLVGQRIPEIMVGSGQKRNNKEEQWKKELCTAQFAEKECT